MPFYVGKGKGRRAYNRWRKIRPPKDRSLIVILESGLSESAAFGREKFYIAKYGRIDNGTGCLRNLTDGGEGLCGRTPWNKGTKGAQVAWNKGKKLPPWTDERRNKYKKITPWWSGTKGFATWGFQKGVVHKTTSLGRKQTEESRRKMSVAKTGKKMAPWTNERRAKIKAAWKAKWIAAGSPKLRKCRRNQFND